MNEENKSGVSIWILLSPLYLLLLIPIYKMVVKNNSSDLSVDRNAFSTDAEVQRRKGSSDYQPMLNNTGSYNVSYSAGKDDKTKEEISWGATEGYLLSALEKNADDPDFAAIVNELYNSVYMVRGFLSREDARYYLFSGDRINKMLSNKASVNAFIAEPGMQAILKNSKATENLLNSRFTDALLSEQAAQDFMKNSAAIEAILTENKTLVRTIKIPAVKKFIISNPKTANLAKAVGWK